MGSNPTRAILINVMTLGEKIAELEKKKSALENKVKELESEIDRLKICSSPTVAHVPDGTSNYGHNMFGLHIDPPNPDNWDKPAIGHFNDY